MFRHFKKWVRNNFGFSRAETNGFLIILLVMLISTMAPFYYRSVSSGPVADPNDRQLMDSLIAQLQDPSADIDIPTASKDSLFVFDPNTVEQAELKTLGLSNFISRNIIKYRESGGVFAYKDNLAKIYGMNDSIYRSVSRFIDLPDRPELSQSRALEQPSGLKKPLEKDHEKVVFDINLADTIDLKEIKGIGSVLSYRVVKYRNLLGGFYSKDQYSEIYNLEPEVITRLASRTIIFDEDCCKKLKISSLSLQELMRHPYLNRAQAKAIIAYRDQHGDFESFDQLKEIHLLDPDTFDRIYPYLEL